MKSNKVLITGGVGFIGAIIFEELRKRIYVIQPILPELCIADERKPTLDHKYSSNDNIMQLDILKETLENFDLMIKEGTTINGELLR